MSKYKIAVIDSGICLEDAFINNASIVSLDSNGKHICSEDTNMHGTYVIRLISREIRDSASIISIKILDDSNKGRLRELCNALKLCIDLQVKIINISLGFSEYKDTQFHDFINLCELCAQLGIVIVAAYNNNNKDVYPALLPYVIGVSTNNKQQYPLQIDRKSRNVLFFHNYIMLPEQPSSLIKGNSYLAPIITGLLYMFAINYELDIDKFLHYISVKCGPCLQNNYWVSNIGDIIEHITNRKVSFIANTITKTNSELVSFLDNSKHKNKVSCISDLNVIDNINDDIVFLGEFNLSEKEIINRVIDFSYTFANNGKDIIMLTPYITMWDRIAITQKLNNKLISLYF